MPMPPDVNAAFDAANATIVATIAEGIANAPKNTLSTPLIEEMEIDDKQVNLPFFLDQGGLQELRRNIEKKGRVRRSISVFAKEWHDNITVRTEDLNAKNLDQYRMDARGMMNKIPDWTDLQVAKLLKSGGVAFVEPSFDGKPYFAADHPMDLAGENISPYSNLDNGGGGQFWYLFDTRKVKPVLRNWKVKPRETQLGPDSEYAQIHYEVMWKLYTSAGFGLGPWFWGYASNQTLDEAHFEAATLQFEGVPSYSKIDSDDALAQMVVMADTIVVGKSNRLKAKKLFETETINGGDKNPMFGAVKVVYLPYLP
jgi:phage major head subunit gpT-like protein